MTITARPYDILWSGNGIWYAFYSALAAGTNTTPADTSVIIEIRLRFKRTDAADFEIGTNIPLIPYQGAASINLSSMVDAELAFGLPSLVNSTDITPCPTQTGKFYIEYRELSATNTDPGWLTDESANIRTVVKGGIPEFKFNNNGFWSRYYPANKPFLSWQFRGRLAAYNEPIYLAWLQRDDVPENSILQVKYTVYYIDVTVAATTKVIYLPDSHQWHVYYLPSGAGMVNLQALNAEQQIWKYTVEVINITDANNIQTLSEVFLFEIDNRPNYNALSLLYRSSTGGLDTIRIRGVIELDTTYQLQPTGKAQLPYYEQNNRITATSYQLPAQEVILYKGDIGHLKKEEQDRLRDLYLQRELYSILDKHWWPLNLSIASLTLRTSTDKVWSMPIEFSLANEGDKYYAPRLADFGTDYADNNTCDALVTDITVVKHFDDTTRIWSTNIGFDVTSAFGHAIGKVQYKTSLAPGVWNDINFPTDSSIDINLPADTFVTVTFRAICDNSYGGLQVPIVVDTTSPGTIGGGGSGSPVKNSRIVNNTDMARVAYMTFNGGGFFSTVVQPTDFVIFYIADMADATVQIRFDDFIPTSVDLVSNGVTYHGVIGVDGNTIFNDVNIVNGIIIYIYSDGLTH